MTNAEWLEGNGKYLAAAVAWVRATLSDYAATLAPAPATTSAPGPVATVSSSTITLPLVQRQTEAREQARKWRSFLQRGNPILLPPPPAQTAAPPPAQTAAPASRESTAAKAAEALEQAGAAIQPPPAMLILAQLLGLSSFEQHILMLCVAVELDSEVAALCARCQRTSRWPTFALAFSIFKDASWDALAPESPLRYWRLIELTAGGESLIASPLRVDERLLSYVKGLNSLDDRLSAYLSPMDLEGVPENLPPSHALVIDRILSALTQKAAGHPVPVIQLLGADSPSKQLLASSIARSLELQLYRLQSASLPAQPAELEQLARLWHRESLLLPVALYIEVPQGAEPPAMLGRFLQRIGGATFLDVRDSLSAAGPHALSLDVTRPTPDEQSAAWKAELGEAAGDNPARLAAQFDLNLPALRRIAQESLAASPTAERAAPAEQAALADRLWNACLAGCRPHMDGLAQRIEPRATWSDFVLPAAETALLRQIAEQVAERATVYQTWGFAAKLSRGLGISALFAGDSGTGKSMAAEVLANHLKLNLYRIDLSAVVSKYIGETEKNLRRLFDHAEFGGAILFFDEADALFGKRSEVKDSHDRYANIEVNYLLQRMEAYRGLAILATNAKSSLDPAFLRRLRFVVNFPFPSAAERKGIWQRVFPAGVPLESLDFDRLARWNLAGGHIHNIALNAAFLAAHARSPVTMPLLFEAAMTEFRKLERPINALDFRLPTQESGPKLGATA
jgi:hypothetical protein